MKEKDSGDEDSENIATVTTRTLASLTVPKI